MTRGFVARIAVVAIALQLGGVSLTGTTACGPTAQSVESREAQDFEYHRPINEVWPELVGLIKDKGDTLTETSPVEGKTLETPWRPAALGCEHRYQIRATRIDAKRYTIHMWLQSQCNHDQQGMKPSGEPIRAWDTEWELVQRAEPLRASEIKKHGQQAQARRDREAEGCNAGCAACATCATCVVDRSTRQ